MSEWLGPCLRNVTVEVEIGIRIEERAGRKTLVHSEREEMHVGNRSDTKTARTLPEIPNRIEQRVRIMTVSPAIGPVVLERRTVRIETTSLTDVPLAVEVDGWFEPGSMTFHQVVLQAIPIRGNTVMMSIPVGVEEWVRISALEESVTREMLDGRQPRANNIGVPALVPVGVE
jgi:hypothetical protein